VIKEVTTGYKPRPHQLYLHQNLKRFNVIVCHRRFGKTHFALNTLIDKALKCQLRNPQMAYLAPTYGQAKRVAWDLLKDYVKNIPGIEINESELRIDIPRPHLQDKIRFLLLGAENPDALRGLYLDYVVLDEYAEMNPDVWNLVIRPALSDRLGGAIFIGTPKSNNHFYEIYVTAQKNKDWFHAMFKAEDTNIIPRSELESARALMSDSEYQQEFQCSFSAANVGAYFGKEMEKAQEEKRIIPLPWEKALPVITAWDLGMDDTTVVWFVQQYGRELRVIDYLEDSGQGLDFYMRVITKKPYYYSQHIFPHDIQVRELGTGKSRLEVVRSMGLKNVKVAPKLPLEDGIEATRRILHKCYFEETKCARGIAALKNFQKKWDSKNKIFSSKPLHDWSSHAADAFRTLAVGLREDEPSDEQKRKLPRSCQSEYDIL
jgi:hypothetical protein